MAAGAILLLGGFGFLALVFSWDRLSTEGSVLDALLVVVIVFFFLIGVLIILGAFFKPPLHILSAITLVFVGSVFFSASFYDFSELVPYLLFLAPLIFYYVVRFVKRPSRRPQ